MNNVLTIARKVKALDVDLREALTEMDQESSDFEVEGYRFIHEDDIDKIMQDELSGDEYVLGCFNGWVLSNVLDVDVDVIRAMQEAEAYEAIGKLVLSLDKLEELQQEYVSADGYGHHFNHWDGSTDTIGEYYVFRV